MQNTAVAWNCWREPSHQGITITQFGWPQCATCRAAPPYHERPQWLPENFTANIYVPLDRFAATLKPGSAVVGVPTAASPQIDGEVEARVLTYYEGWVYDYDRPLDRETWAEGLLHAAGRMIAAYPTVAQAFVRAREVQAVGYYNPRTREVVLDDEDALNHWLST